MKTSRLVLCALAFLVMFSIHGQSLAQRVSSNDNVDGPQYSVKATLLSLGSGSSRFTIERALGTHNSAEFTVGVIGWGWDWMNAAQSDGVLIKLAYKWNIIPQQSAHTPLAGFYVKPELVYADFDYKARGDNAAQHHTRQVALLAECGCQLVYKWFVFDPYCGVGPSVGTDNHNNYFHSFMLFPAKSHLAFTAGFRVGIAL